MQGRIDSLAGTLRGVCVRARLSYFERTANSLNTFWREICLSLPMPIKSEHKGNRMMNREIWPSSAKRKVSTKGSIPWTCDGLKTLHILSSSLRSPANQTQRNAQTKELRNGFCIGQRETFTDSLSAPLRGLRRPVSNLLPTSCVMKCWA